MTLYKTYLTCILQVRKLKFRKRWNPFSPPSCERIWPGCFAGLSHDRVHPAVIIQHEWTCHWKNTFVICLKMVQREDHTCPSSGHEWWKGTKKTGLCWALSFLSISVCCIIDWTALCRSRVKSTYRDFPCIFPDTPGEILAKRNVIFPEKHLLPFDSGFLGTWVMSLCYL